MATELHARRRARRDSILGRRTCTVCKRWRHACTDFSVSSWEDSERTRPKVLHSKCKLCARAYSREWKRRRCRPATPAPPRGVLDVLSSMSAEDRFSFPLEGGVPLTRYSVADEDFDPTPVPRGCPGCFTTRTDSGSRSEVCINCPDKAEARRLRGGRWA
jgi:hypothetical protein